VHQLFDAEPVGSLALKGFKAAIPVVDIRSLIPA